jgi:predicted Zn-ribbon and HTH transcriptional regulator
VAQLDACSRSQYNPPLVKEFSEPLVLDFYLGVVTHCPPGEAFGCHDLNQRGRSDWKEITVWPKNTVFPLFGGGPPEPHHFIKVRGVRLWNQEMYVYLQERNRSIGAMLEDLDLMDYLPRKQGTHNLVEPLADDFGSECIWCGYKWMPEETDPRRTCPACTKPAMKPPRRRVWKAENHPEMWDEEFADFRKARTAKARATKAAKAAEKSLDTDVARSL